MDSPFEVIGGGIPTDEEAAAIAAALAVVLVPEPSEPEAGRWRWSGRSAWPQRHGRWDQPAADWRDPGATAHSSLS